MVVGPSISAGGIALLQSVYAADPAAGLHRERFSLLCRLNIITPISTTT
jgi:hypothetical protein